MLNSGYQEGSFSAQISEYRTQVAHAQAENIHLKGIITELHKRVAELETVITSLNKDCGAVNESIKETVTESVQIESTDDNTSKKNKSKK